MSGSVPAQFFLAVVGVEDPELTTKLLRDYFFNFTHVELLVGDASENACYATFGRRTAYSVTSGACFNRRFQEGGQKQPLFPSCASPSEIPWPQD
jgi:hypothetical protein